LWLYVVAPVCGALIAVAGCRCIREEGCCVPLAGRCAIDTTHGVTDQFG
jgi:hypothetical protein